MNKKDRCNDRAAVIVLGDVGRSPRMCYHAKSLAEHGVRVDLIGYLTRSHLIIDWHNYTYSILEWEHGRGKSVVRWAKNVEKMFGPKADANLCVTHAMRSDLLQTFKVRAVTLYDRPPAGKFEPFTVGQKHEFFQRMAGQAYYQVFMSDSNTEPAYLKEYPEVTAFSYKKDRSNGNGAKLRTDRPAILVSGTSWTLDEDFGILLQALERSEVSQRLPKIVAIITGKGPMKSHYLEQIKEKKLTRVEFLTPWLEAEDYPKMLACSDLGVSLHASTSGLDLPMKIVDMFGVGLPVLAKKFDCIDELVKTGENGQTFQTSQELSSQLISLLRGFPEHSQKLTALHANLQDVPLVSWQDNWDATVWPMLAAI